MTPFHMTPSLMTGHIQIDTEHEHLLVLLNQIDSLIKAGDDKGCGAIIAELSEALKDHLHNEETIMEGHGYPGLADHKEKHEMMRTGFTALEEDARLKGYNVSFLDKLITLFSDDLIAADMDFKAYLEKMTYKG